MCTPRYSVKSVLKQLTKFIDLLCLGTSWHLACTSVPDYHDIVVSLIWLISLYVHLNWVCGLNVLTELRYKICKVEKYNKADN